MLTTTSPKLKRITGMEALRRSFEETDKELIKYRLDDQDALKNAEARMGKPMSHSDLFRRVSKCNPRITMEDSLNDPLVAGFYLTTREGKKYLVAFDKGYLPEFSIVVTDNADLPIKERRGWRTVLLRLLKQRALTWRQILAVWGDAHGHSSKLWQIQTRHYK